MTAPPTDEAAFGDEDRAKMAGMAFAQPGVLLAIDPARVLAVCRDLDAAREAQAKAERERDAMKAALEPFASATDNDDPDDEMIRNTLADREITRGDLRAAARAYHQK